MTDRTKYNLQFVGLVIGVILLIVFGLIVIACAINRQTWAFIVLLCVPLGMLGFAVNEWRKDYIVDKSKDKIFEDEMNIVMNKVVQCKDCKINPSVWFRGYGCHIMCPECGKSTGGELDPLDDVAEWNKMNKKQRREK